jgi:hypothetical protein
MGREDRRREELAEREADNLFIDDDELVDDDDFLEGDEIIEESGPYPRPRPTEQEMMGREDARTEELANREADRLLGRGRGCAPCLQDYDMIIKHLLEHITDPEEPIDPKDYDHAIHFIKRIRRMKGGVLHLMRQKRTAVPLFGGMDSPRPGGEEEPYRSLKQTTKAKEDREEKIFRIKVLRTNIQEGLYQGKKKEEKEELVERLMEELGARPTPYGRGWEEKPAKSGNAFLDAITTIGHEAGKAHPASKFVNPFDAGFKFGEKVVAPAMMKTKWGNPHTGIFSKKFWTPKKKHH